MPGSLAANLYAGNRSEYLALYVFSLFGTATQVPREADYGLDLACTLTRRDGQRARPYAYYSVQVKSSDDPWIFDNTGDVEWVLRYPAPLLFCVVDKATARFRVYHMGVRFLAAVVPDLPQSLAVVPGRPSGVHETRHYWATWDTEGNLYLGEPILDFQFMDLLVDEKFENIRNVLDFWVDSDMKNVVRQQMGMRAASVPGRYETNQRPTESGFGRSSSIYVTDEVRRQAELTAAEHLAWLGEVLLAGNDRVGALLAGMLVRHLVEHLRPGDVSPRDLGFSPTSIYGDLHSAAWLRDAVDDAAYGYVSGPVDAFVKEIELRTSGSGTLGKLPDARSR